jgi:hypothetical protein
MGSFIGGAKPPEIFIDFFSGGFVLSKMWGEIHEIQHLCRFCST